MMRVLLPSLATADEPERNEEWLVELRHSGSYKKGREEIIALSRESLYAALVRKVLFVIYDYGYVQGAKHRLGKQVESHGLPVGKKPE
jgi:hypothetical protein